MPIESSWKDIRASFLKRYGKERGEKIYYSWLNKYGLDDSKAPIGENAPPGRKKKEEAIVKFAYGAAHVNDCPTCAGDGVTNCSLCNGNGVAQGKTCAKCGGRGTMKCPACKGNGTKEEGDYLKNLGDSSPDSVGKADQTLTDEQRERMELLQQKLASGGTLSPEENEEYEGYQSRLNTKGEEKTDEVMLNEEMAREGYIKKEMGFACPVEDCGFEQSWTIDAPKAKDALNEHIKSEHRGMKEEDSSLDDLKEDYISLSVSQGKTWEDADKQADKLSESALRKQIDQLEMISRGKVMREEDKCPACKHDSYGFGCVKSECDCDVCHNTGVKREDMADRLSNDDEDYDEMNKCKTCDGRGWFSSDREGREDEHVPCPDCQDGGHEEEAGKDGHQHSGLIKDMSKPNDENYIYMKCPECDMPISISKKGRKEGKPYIPKDESSIDMDVDESWPSKGGDSVDCTKCSHLIDEDSGDCGEKDCDCSECGPVKSEDKEPYYDICTMCGHGKKSHSDGFCEGCQIACNGKTFKEEDGVLDAVKGLVKKGTRDGDEEAQDIADGKEEGRGSGSDRRQQHCDECGKDVPHLSRHIEQYHSNKYGEEAGRGSGSDKRQQHCDECGKDVPHLSRHIEDYHSNKYNEEKPESAIDEVMDTYMEAVEELGNLLIASASPNGYAPISNDNPNGNLIEHASPPLSWGFDAISEGQLKVDFEQVTNPDPAWFDHVTQKMEDIDARLEDYMIKYGYVNEEHMKEWKETTKDIKKKWMNNA